MRDASPRCQHRFCCRVIPARQAEKRAVIGLCVLLLQKQYPVCWCARVCILACISRFRSYFDSGLTAQKRSSKQTYTHSSRRQRSAQQHILARQVLFTSYFGPYNRRTKPKTNEETMVLGENEDGVQLQDTNEKPDLISKTKTQSTMNVEHKH